MTTSLPTINVASLFEATATPAQRKACGLALMEALTTTGFVILRQTSVPATVLAQMRNAVRAVFEAPRSLYADVTVQKNNYRGYVPLGYFTPNSGSGRADQYEAWKLHSESGNTEPNRWPPIAFDVKGAVLGYWAEMDRLNDAILTALAEPLELSAATLLGMMERPLTNMTLLNYPPAKAGHWGIHPHKDFNFLTFLAHDPVGGLEVRTRNGSWIDAHCEEGQYIMNVGDMLELLSGGRLVSTPHRVTNRGQLQRQSFPYFSVPRADVLVQPLLERLPGFEREPLMSGAASHDIWYSNWPDAALQDTSIDLGDYAG